MYPEDVKIFIDGKDRTAWIFGPETINPSDAKNSWSNIDITQFVKAKGTHIIEATCEGGVGRLEIIVEMS
jgi:hypothetical protein